MKPESLRDTQFGGSHYKSMGIEPVQYAKANDLDCLQFSVVKYVTRHKLKGQADDLKKALHFITMALEMDYGVKTTFSFDAGPEAKLVPSPTPPHEKKDPSR